VPYSLRIRGQFPAPIVNGGGDSFLVAKLQATSDPKRLIEVHDPHSTLPIHNFEVENIVKFGSFRRSGTTQ